MGLALKLKVATNQFPVRSDIGKNLTRIKKQIQIAAEKKADVIHFCECSLSSYVGIDFRKLILR